MTGNTRRNSRNKPKPSIDDDEDQHQSSNTKNKSKIKLKKEKTRFLSSSKVIIYLGLFAIFVFAISTYFIYSNFMNFNDYGSRKPRVITPFPAPKLMDLPQVSFNFMNIN